MKQFIEQCGNYCIFRVGSEYLHEIAEFIVMANYNHHSPKIFPAKIREEIEAVYQEELTYISSSQVFLVENNNGKMIGCIRVMKWDRVNELPIQKILIKYGDRGYRFILQEVGFLTQNIALLAEFLGLESCILGSYVDDNINQILAADGTFETVQNVIVIGKNKEVQNDHVTSK